MPNHDSPLNRFMSYKLKIDKKELYLLDFSIILVVGLFILRILHDNSLIVTLDFSIRLMRIKSFIRSFYVWDTIENSLGGVNTRIIAGIIPYESYLALTELIGIDLITTQKIFFYLLFTLSGLSMYYLSITLTHKRISSLVASLFYMVNPYTIIWVWPTIKSAIILYSFLPLKLALFIKGIDERKGFKYVFILCLVWLITSTTSYVNPVYLLVDVLPLLFYFIFSIFAFRDRNKILSALKFSIYFMLIFLALNMYWILPTSFFISDEFYKAGIEVVGRTDIDTFNLNSVKIIDALRLMGIWSFSSSYHGDPYYYWAPLYSSYVLTPIGFLMVLLIFMPLIFKRSYKHDVFFCILSVIALFLLKGGNEPLGNLTLSAFVDTFTVRLFRNPWDKFGILTVLGYSYLIGQGVSVLSDMTSKIVHGKNSSNIRLLFALSLTLLLIIPLGWPLWTGDLMFPGGRIMPSSQVRIPGFYYEAMSQMDTKEDYRILSLPISKLGYGSFWWDEGSSGYLGPDPVVWLSPKPVIVNSQSGLGIAGFITDLLMRNDSQSEATKMLSLLNVKYILYHNDSNWRFLEGHPWWISTTPDKFNLLLNSNRFLYKEKPFGELDFYANEKWESMHIYATTKSILSMGGLDDILNVVKRNDFQPKGSVLLVSSQLDVGQLLSTRIGSVFIRDVNTNSALTLSNELRDDTRIFYLIEKQPDSIFIPKAGNYILSVKANIENGCTDFNIKVDDRCFIINTQDVMSVSTYIGPLNLAIGDHNISVSGPDTVIPVYDGWKNPVNWNSSFHNQSFVARFYRLPNASYSIWSDTRIPPLVHESLPYPLNISSWNLYNTTLVYIVTGNESLKIDAISSNGRTLTDIKEIQINNNTMTLSMNPITYPFIITQKQKKIILMKGKMEEISIKTNMPSIQEMSLYSLRKGEAFIDADKILSSELAGQVAVTFEKINPTKYIVHVISSEPFFLVFSESYNKYWTISIDGQIIPDERHFMANGYANSWYVDRTGNFEITLEFWPQKLFYIGIAISFITLIACVLYFYYSAKINFKKADKRFSR